jgi:hypothetical protein
MLVNCSETFINAPIENVWDILTDVEKYNQWNPLLYMANGKIKQGEIVIIHAKTATKDMRLKCQVTKVEPLRELTWTFSIIHTFLFQGVHTFRLEPGEGGLKFIDREKFTGLLLPTQAKDLRTNGLTAMIEMGKALKARSEQTEIAW